MLLVGGDRGIEGGLETTGMRREEPSHTINIDNKLAPSVLHVF